MDEIQFSFDGKIISESDFGPGYVSEFKHVIRDFVPGPPKNVLEWGSGISSLILLEQCAAWTSGLFLTIDENAAYQRAVFAGRFIPAFVCAAALDQIGSTLNQSDAKPNYTSYPLTRGREFDLVFIDGRRRIECAYIAMLVAQARTIVILHDYRRARYQSVLRMYEVLEDGPQFRVMRPRPEVYRALHR